MQISLVHFIFVWEQNMNFKSFRPGLFAIALSGIGLGLTPFAASAEEYSFRATNVTNTTITEILVSENRRDWGYFDIGNGLRPGATITLVWDQSTNSENCAQWVKAAYADGSESEPAMFNFCEAGLAIDF